MEVSSLTFHQKFLIAAAIMIGTIGVPWIIMKAKTMQDYEE